MPRASPTVQPEDKKVVLSLVAILSRKFLRQTVEILRRALNI